MRPSVRVAFVAFTAPMEGVVPWLYPDVKGLVSIGIGNLVDPIGLALGLPLVHPDGTPATRAEIAEEWRAVKAFPDGVRLGHLALKNVAKLRLTDDGVQQVVGRRLDEMDRYLARRFGDEYEAWPADAQLGTLSMAWACGPAFQFPKLEAALRAQDFRTAAHECFMPEERTISGLRPRNRADRILFLNAMHVAGMDLDRETLYWPRDLDSERMPDFEIVHPLPDPQPPSE